MVESPVLRSINEKLSVKVTSMTIEIRLGDVVRLRKQHPCGGYNWDVVRLGADIGLQCTTCSRRVPLTRREFGKRLKTFVQRGDPASGAAPQAPMPAPPSS